MNKISLFGKGYIGSEFVRQFQDKVIVESKFDYIPSTPKILYGISTTHNYHVHDRPHLDIDTNLTTLITFLENTRKQFGSNTDITFLSSWFVYGRQTHFPVKEDAHCKPKGFYSITKHAAEQLLASYCETFGMKYRILRLANIIGGNDKSAGEKKNALQYMIDTLCNDGEVQLYNADIYRDYLDVKDAVIAIRLAMTSESGEIINIGSGDYHSIKDLVHFAQSIAGRGTIELIPVPNFHEQVQTDRMWMDDIKIRKLGFVPNYTVYDTITEMVRERISG